MKKSLKPPDARGGRRIRRGSYFQRISARHGMARRSTTLTFLDTRVPTRMRWNPTVIPRGPCSRKGETGRIVRGRGWSIWTHAPGATRGSRSVITSASLSLFRIPLDPLDLHRVRTRRTRCTRVLSRVWGRERGGILSGSTYTHMIARPQVHTNSECRGMGLHYVGVSTNTHARLRKRLGLTSRSGRNAEERESTPHATRFCASSSSALHKAHICVIVPAGSIRPMLFRRTRSYGYSMAQKYSSDAVNFCTI